MIASSFTSSPVSLARVGVSLHGVTFGTTARIVNFLAVRGDSLLIALSNHRGLT